MLENADKFHPKLAANKKGWDLQPDGVQPLGSRLSKWVSSEGSG